MSHGLRSFASQSNGLVNASLDRGFASSAAKKDRGGPASKKTTAPSSSPSPSRRVVYVDGYRTPFKLSGTDYEDLMAVDLSQQVLKGLIDRTMVDPKEVDYIMWGNVIQEGKDEEKDRYNSLFIYRGVAWKTVWLLTISSSLSLSLSLSFSLYFFLHTPPPCHFV